MTVAEFKAAILRDWHIELNSSYAAALLAEDPDIYKSYYKLDKLFGDIKYRAAGQTR